MTPTDHETEEWVLLPRDPDEAMIVAVDRTGCLDAAQNGSVADAVREVYGAAISAAPTPPAPSLPAGAAAPVAWRVKDFADGWILFHVEALARHEAAETGALIQPLYADVSTIPAKSNTSAEPVKPAGSAEGVKEGLAWSFDINGPVPSGLVEVAFYGGLELFNVQICSARSTRSLDSYGYPVEPTRLWVREGSDLDLNGNGWKAVAWRKIVPPTVEEMLAAHASPTPTQTGEGQ